MIAEFDTVRLKKNGKLYTVVDISEDRKTGIPYYYLETQNWNDENDDDWLIDAEIGDIEFVSRHGNPIVDKLIQDYEKRPIFQRYGKPIDLSDIRNKIHVKLWLFKVKKLGERGLNDD